MTSAKRRKSKSRGKSGARTVAALVFGLVLVVMLLLGTVWKQVYITSQSIRHDELADSLSVLSGEAARLKLICGRLSRTGRIERIARQRIGLEYPSLDQIEIVKIESPGPRRASIMGERAFAAFVRKSLFKSEG